ncbi:antibiotic biosynthesis monooxygenase family protein [Modestobacter lapidis]|nr:antibiotic biosynthesis monooxygenase [Modestobacter lapidis]
MVLEQAVFEVVPGTEAEFVAAYGTARQLVEVTQGCLTMRMTRGVEVPNRFVLLVEWESIESHEDFRANDRFPRWRALIGEYFSAPPKVEHLLDL